MCRYIAQQSGVQVPNTPRCAFNINAYPPHSFNIQVKSEGNTTGTRLDKTKTAMTCFGGMDLKFG